MKGTSPLISESVPLAPLTTIRLGGPAKYFSPCSSARECWKTLEFARERGLPLFVLGGGSNTIFPDEGFSGVVLHVNIPGITFTDTAEGTVVVVGAGESWDGVVAACVDRGLGGIECLAGIPGTAGATPIQNVGAYGQEVQERILSVHTLDRSSAEERELAAAECGFSYRWSRFKGEDAERFVVTAVTFRLEPMGRPRIHYPELLTMLEEEAPLASLTPGRPALSRVRNTVLRLRRSKGMVIDPHDPDSRSVGSFFMNPVLDPAAFRALQQREHLPGGAGTVPSYPSAAGVKIPAAWLVERAGFSKGTQRGGVGISSKHALALVNRGGSTSDLLALAREIQTAVEHRFQIRLSLEPVVVTPSPDRNQA